jgi:hypothetical protein
VKFDPMPAQIVANCADLANNKLSRPVWYVYGQTRDASGRSFYVTGGYMEMLDGRPKAQRFLTEEPGIMFYIDARTCQSLDPPRDVFDEPESAKALTPPILKQLATDDVRRLEQAFGGPDQLRAEIKNQRIDFDQLSPELQEAFAPYFGK